MLARVHIQTLNYDMIIIQYALFRLLISLLATWPVNIHAESRNNTYCGDNLFGYDQYEYFHDDPCMEHS